MKKFVKNVCALALLSGVVFFSGCSDDDKDIEVQKITLNETAVTLDPAETVKLVATVEPADATNKRIVWSSDNESIATVDSEGTVTAVAPGTAKITVTSSSNSSVSASATITVNEIDHALKVVGTYVGQLTMNGQVAGTGIELVMTHAAPNKVKVVAGATIMGADLTITYETIDVTINEDDTYNVSGEGLTSNYGYGEKKATLDGTIDKDGNIVLDLTVDSISEKLVYSGKKK